MHSVEATILGSLEPIGLEEVSDVILLATGILAPTGHERHRPV